MGAVLHGRIRRLIYSPIKTKAMKYGVNRVTLVGNVGDDPKVIEKNGEVQSAAFPFATSETFKNNEGQEVTQTQWHRCKLWGKKAMIVRDYVKKGDSLYIEGKVVYNRWTDKEGVEHYGTEIVVENFLFLKSRAAQE